MIISHLSFNEKRMLFQKVPELWSHVYLRSGNELGNYRIKSYSDLYIQVENSSPRFRSPFKDEVGRLTMGLATGIHSAVVMFGTRCQSGIAYRAW